MQWTLLQKSKDSAICDWNYILLNVKDVVFSSWTDLEIILLELRVKCPMVYCFSSVMANLYICYLHETIFHVVLQEL